VQEEFAIRRLTYAVEPENELIDHVTQCSLESDELDTAQIRN
jgi:hypothetical protein